MEGDQKVGQPAGMAKKGNSGLIIILVVVLLVVGAGAYFVSTKNSNKSKSNVPVTTSSSGGASIRWQMSADGTYKATGTPPTCPSPLVINPPADLSKAASILYPGQTRGNDYKPHGGVRFADGSNEIAITAPMDATVIDGSRYLVDGEVQYLFDFVNDCGIKYRLGHLRTLSPAFATLAEQLPAAQNMDSRTTQISAKVKAGDPIASAVGLVGAGNAFFDFGVFDLRGFNEASKDSQYQTTHANDKDLSWHAICWFNVLSSANKAIVKNLPATSPGSQSDYCKSGVDTYTPPADTSASTTSSANSTTSTSGSVSGSGAGGGSGSGSGGGTGAGR